MRTMENWTSCLIDPEQWRQVLRKEKRHHDAMTLCGFYNISYGFMLNLEI